MNKIYWWCRLPKKSDKQNNLELIEEFLRSNTPFKITIFTYQEYNYYIKPSRSYFKEQVLDLYIYGEVSFEDYEYKVSPISYTGKWFDKRQILKVEKW